ncbi:MAG: hypothetical protein QOJ13_815 [Gaiellales bacterium]|nr:hypothetical protein [Gaiellales bacterium]
MLGPERLTCPRRGRTEGGFDCSGLIGYAYSAAGAPLPGRPTADSLWRMSQPIPSAELQPGDLVFAGTSGTAYHVGLYAGDGEVLSAPRTGEVVGFSPLAAGSWDGFGRLLPAEGAPATRDAGIEKLARRHGVPWHVLDAEQRLGLIDDPAEAAVALAAAQRRHPGSLEEALTEQLGSASAAALVLREGSGLGLGDGFGAQVRLIPVGDADPAAGIVAGARTGAGPRPTAVVRPSAPAGPSLLDQVGAALHAAESAAKLLGERGRAVPLHATAAVRTGLRHGVVGLSVFLPDPDWRDGAGFAGAVWDAGASTVDLARTHATGGLRLAGWSLWAARLSVIGGTLSTGLFGWQALTARSRRDRVGYGLMAAGSAATTVGLVSGGAALMTLGAGAAVIPPVGLALIATGAALCAAGYLVRHPEWGRVALNLGGRALDTAWRVQTAPVRAAASVGGAVVDRAKSLLGSVPTPW